MPIHFILLALLYLHHQKKHAAPHPHAHAPPPKHHHQ